MFEGILEGLFILFLGWAMAAIFFVFGIKDMSLSLARLLAVILASATPFMAYHVSAEHYVYRMTTLHEEILEGSLVAIPGFPAPIRQAVFRVEKTDVAYDCAISPITSDQTVFPARIVGEITGPDNKVLLRIDESFEVAEEQYGSRIKQTRKVWREKVFSFTPTHSGEHHITLIPVTAGIPKLKFRISDPTKTAELELKGSLARRI